MIAISKTPLPKRIIEPHYLFRITNMHGNGESWSHDEWKEKTPLGAWLVNKLLLSYQADSDNRNGFNKRTLDATIEYLRDTQLVGLPLRKMLDRRDSDLAYLVAEGGPLALDNARIFKFAEVHSFEVFFVDSKGEVFPVVIDKEVSWAEYTIVNIEGFE